MKSCQSKPFPVTRPPWPDRLGWYLFGNANDGVAPAGYLPGKPLWYRKIRWWLRNPFHNACFFGIGFADVQCTAYGRYPSTPFAPSGFNYGFVVPSTHKWLYLPFISYKGTWVEWYWGWRLPEGSFGIKIRRP